MTLDDELMNVVWRILNVTGNLRILTNSIVGLCELYLWRTRCVQLECARVLLFRGADKNILNRTTFDAHRVACISQHKRIADLIESFQSKDVGKYKQPSGWRKKTSRTVRNYNGACTL